MIKIFKYLKSINLINIKRYADVSGTLLVIILALDLHRFGAWYTGDATYLYPYALPVLLVLGAPVVLYAAAAGTQRAVAREQYTLLYLSGLFVCCLPFTLWNPFVFDKIFKAEKWYDPGILRPVDAAFIKGLIVSLIITTGIVLILWLLGQLYRVASHSRLVQNILKYL